MEKVVRGLLSVLGVVFMVTMIAATIGRHTYQKKRDAVLATIERANSNCPMQLPDSQGVVTAIKLEDGYVTYYIRYNDRQRPLLDESEVSKESLFMGVQLLNGIDGKQGDKAIDFLRKNDLGLKLVAMLSGRVERVYKASAEELSEAYNKYKNNPQQAYYDMLQEQIEINRRHLPAKIDDGFTQTSISLDNGYIIYGMEVDEDMYDLSVMRESKEQMKASIIESFQEDVQGKALAGLCKACHVGIIYRVRGNISGKKFSIMILWSDINKFAISPESPYSD